MLPTYHPSAYLHTHDRRYLEALQMGIDWLFSNRTLPQISFKEIDFIPSKYLDTPYVLDIETPWGKYLGDKDFKINAIGILSLASDTAYILKNPRELSKLNGLCIGHNLVYDFSVLSHFGIKLPKKAFDTIIALKLLRPFEFTYRLKSWVSFMGYPHYWEDFYNSEGKVPKEYLYKYLAYDLYMTRELYNLLDYELNTNWTNLMPIIELYQDLLPSVGRMVGNGLTVDIDALNRENEKIESEVSKIETHFKDLNINLNSPKQLLQYLHSLGFRERRTSEEALKSFNHPVSKLILKRRKLLKVKDTYIDPLLENSRNGRIYSDCMVHGTLTGRFTRHDPPVQTIPRAYRSIFRSRSDDHVLLSVDFDQIEFRLIADVSKEGKLYDVTDIHTETASRLGLERDIAKTLNYAVIYGAHAQRISETGGISYQEAERLIRDFYQIFPRIKKFIDKTHAQVVDKKYVSSPFGRYWDFSHIESDEMMHKIQRQAVNYIIQSMAHDILMVYWNLLNPLLDKDILVINDVHDELVLDVPQKKLDKAKNLCYNALRKVKEDIRRRFNYDVKVPITISFSVGRNWSK